MTINYLDSKRIVALSTDEAPTPDLTYDDFPTSYSGWTKSSNDATKLAFSSNRANFSIGETYVDARAYGYDIGFDLDGDYCIDFDFTFTNTPFTSSGQAVAFTFGISTTTADVSGEDPTMNSEQTKMSGYPSGSYTYIYARAKSSAGTNASGNESNTAFPLNSSATQLRYGRLSRSGTTFRVQFFSDSTRETEVANYSVTTTAQTVRYLNLKSYSQNSGQAWSAYLDNIKIYKDQSSPTPVKPTNVQNNSILVEKDTGKRYWFDVSKDTTKDGTNSNITLDTTNEKLGTGCYDFNGSTSRSVTSVKFNGLHDNTGGSISFWMRPRNMSSIHGNGDYIFDSMATSAANGTGISIAIKNTSLLRVNFTTSSNGWFTDINSTTQFANNTWYHVVMTFGSNTVKLYINGSQEDTATFSNPNTNASNGNFVIGRHSTDPSSYGYYDGLLDDTGIWNRVITSSEVTSLYNSGTGALASSISTTGFAGYYNYDAVTGGKLENETTTATWTYPPTYTGDYSSTSGWTQATTNTANSGTGSQTVGIDGGWAYANSTGSANGQFVHTSLGITLNDTKWVADFEYYNIGAVNMYPFVLAAGTSSSWDSTQDMVSVVEAGTNVLMIRYRDGSSQANSSASSTMSTNTSYFCRLIRDGQVLTLKMYTDSARTSQHGSDITVTISGSVTGLTTLHHSGITGGGATSGYNFKVRGTEIYNGVTSV